MNFITPLLFVLYLQVMPPPPPTMNGGGDYWSGYTISNGDTINTWDRYNLNKSLNGLDGQGYTDKNGDPVAGVFLGANGVDEVLNKIQLGTLVLTKKGEWLTLLARSNPQDPKGLGSRTRFNRACGYARTIGENSGGNEAADIRGCSDNISIPSELLSLCVLSFIVTCFYFRREAFQIPDK